MLNPHTKLDIDWEWFNNRLDRQDGCERTPAPHLALKQQIADGNLADGLAIDDGVAIHVCDGIITNIIRARQDGENAYIIRKDENKADVQPLNLGHKVI